MAKKTHIELSVIIPARNEEGVLEETLTHLSAVLRAARISHEIIVVNDYSTDGTAKLLAGLKKPIPTLRVINNPGRPGFGMALRVGFASSLGDAIAPFMADASDPAEDLVQYYDCLEESGADCVFGSRFVPGGRALGYPILKLVFNRTFNTFVRLLFGIPYNDITNAFKLYRRETLEGLRPYLSVHFNLTVELPLKAIIRGYRYEIVPNNWMNRKKGFSKLKMREMGSRYLFIVFYCFIEKWLSRGDYRIPIDQRRGELPVDPRLSNRTSKK